MNRKFFALVLFMMIATISLSSCVTTSTDIAGGIQGAGPMVSRPIQTEDFASVNVSGAYRVIYRQDRDVSVIVKMQENLFDILDISVRNGTLYVDSARSFNTSDANRPRLYISAPTNEGISFDGAVDATEWDPVYAQRFFIGARGAGSLIIPLEVELLDIDVEGGVSLELLGNVGAANILVEGAANISAGNLQIRNTRIELHGAGTVNIAVSGFLDVEINGVGHVRYTGDPVVTQRISGLGTVQRNY